MIACAFCIKAHSLSSDQLSLGSPTVRGAFLVHQTDTKSQVFIMAAFLLVVCAFATIGAAAGLEEIRRKLKVLPEILL